MKYSKCSYTGTYVAKTSIEYILEIIKYMLESIEYILEIAQLNSRYSVVYAVGLLLD